MYRGLIHRHGKDLSRLLRILDVVIPPSLFLLIHERDSSPVSATMLWSVVLLIGIISSLIFPLGGIYEPFRHKSLYTLLRRLSVSWLMVLSWLLFLAFATKSTDLFSRVEVVLWGLLVWVGLVGIHVGGRTLLRVHRSLGGNSRAVLFWGGSDVAIRLFRELQETPHLGMKLMAWFTPLSGPTLSLPAGMPECSGGFSEMQNYIEAHNIDHIFFNHEPETRMSIDQLISFFGNTCIPVHYIPCWANAGMCFKVETIGNSFCIGLWGNDQSLVDRHLKRLMDIIFSALAVALLSPLLLLIAFLIKVTSPGPIFFLQDRYGLDGKKFKILKFRTMNVVER